MSESGIEPGNHNRGQEKTAAYRQRAQVDVGRETSQPIICPESH